jgi:nicotinate-nucleotide pyrophosphorylase (carboxylating)
MRIPDFIIRKRILEFLEEDLYYGDITEIAGVGGEEVVAEILSKDSGVLAGIRVAKLAFEMFEVDTLRSLKDGDKVEPKRPVMVLRGSAERILMLERTVLNILMKMSGIATATAELVERARKVNPRVRIAATRKTTPGFRMFEKMAVEIGGGDTHRMGLGDCVLIKDNHVAVAGSIADAIKVARTASFTKKIEIEVKSVEEAVIAAMEGVDIIMLDNFTVDEVRKTLKLLEEKGVRESVIVEVSGGINLKNIEEYAAAGVDVISCGYITLSAGAIDMSLRIIDE